MNAPPHSADNVLSSASEASLHKSAWGVTAYFNPTGSRVKKAHYHTFRQGLADAGIPLLTVECVLPGQAPDLSAADADGYLTVSSASTLWHREILCQIAVQHLPEACSAVALLDCDLVFDNPRWLEEAEGLLGEYEAVQGFQYLVRLDKGEPPEGGAELPVGREDMERIPSFGFGLVEGREEFFNEGTVPGIRFGSWVFRKELLLEVGLYDLFVLGGFDHVFIHALFPELDAIERAKEMVSYPTPGLEEWCKALGEQVQGKVGYSSGICYHLFHGSPAQRRYGNRYREPLLAAFEPERDLERSEDGVWQLTDRTGPLARYLKRHFWLRNDDNLWWKSLLCWLYIRGESVRFRVQDFFGAESED